MDGKEKIKLSIREDILLNTDKRLFYISNDIDNETMGKMCFNLLYLLQEDDSKEAKEKDFKREPIKIYINSYGGSVYDMWSLIDIILNAKSPIYTYCTGYAMSAAFQIFLAGRKRFSTKHSTFMYHQMSCWRQGKYQDLVEDREQMDYLQKTIEEYVIDRTNLTKSDLDDIRERKRDFFINPQDALKWGIVDEIL